MVLPPKEDLDSTKTVHARYRISAGCDEHPIPQNIGKAHTIRVATQASKAF
jgi:hypothetical protein